MRSCVSTAVRFWRSCGRRRVEVSGWPLAWTATAWADGVRNLTQRELQVARLGAEGYTAAEIARRLHIGDRTVESHLASAYSKLRIRSRLQLIRMASELGAPPEV
ncbi:MAG: helix-turn-helix transcriptional regulator [Chloroflexi bacterium]|nr:MAG: helix-turn-helix transcriptional regulator [Chloroflexota bacterium]TMG08473.1 MAG: helix-turn-helix transcriptional regulator [Chloroflexota bacterium]